MHFHVADAYLDTGSVLHRLDSRVKVVITVLLILLIGLTPMGAFGAYVGFFALMMIGAVLARVDPWLVVRRSMVALPFAAAAVTLVFTVPGRTLATLPVAGLSISEAGLIRFVSILFKSMISVQAAVLLMLTTHFTDMLWALGALRVPRVLVAIISFMYRYIFVLVDEAMRLSRARDSRSAVLAGQPERGQSVLFRARTTGRMIGNLFLRSLERSERVYQAMLSRGYRGELRQLSPPSLSGQDVLVGLIAVGVGMALTGISLLLR
ncbi:MAG TPA: cobalt ECF transporter T component CbiQ [Chloroflexi bacterium]|nr:cobalt ECF transporter T component CbiQ [Chloroflexota bacterium]